MPPRPSSRTIEYPGTPSGGGAAAGAGPPAADRVTPLASNSRVAPSVGRGSQTRVEWASGGTVEVYGMTGPILPRVRQSFEGGTPVSGRNRGRLAVPAAFRYIQGGFAPDRDPHGRAPTRPRVPAVHPPGVRGHRRPR